MLSLRTMFLILVMAGGVVFSQGQMPQDSLEWFYENREQVYDAIMPLRLPELLVAYRSSEDPVSHLSERYFAVQYVRFGVGFVPNSLKAIVKTPVGESIQRQLIRLRAKLPTGSVKELITKVNVKTEEVDVDHCRGIISQANQLAEVPVAIPRRDMITLDGPVHQIEVQVPNLKMSVSFEGGNPPLVAWAKRTHEVVSACVLRGR